MTAADPTRDRTAPEAEEKAPSAAVPGVPAPEPPALEEPTTPREPLPPKPDQRPAGGGVADRRPTGAPEDSRAQQRRLPHHRRTALRLRDTDHSLKAGPRGPDAAAGPPPAREDHPLRPRAHPRAGRARPRRRRARRLPRPTARPPTVTRAGFLAKDVETPVFVRFSTVLGSRGSADTVRDTRGFATKFYTDEGTFDLVGNNIPVFFIQDGIKFPDVIHAGQAAPGPGDPAGAERPRHLLGLRVAAHRGAAPHACGTCPTAASRAPTGRWRASASTPSGWSTPRAAPRW